MVYAPPADFLIKSLKFHDRPACARLMGEIIALSLQSRDIATLPECLLPVPLHPARLRERGFNQAIAIARPLARRLGLPLDPHSLRRVRHTAAQSTLPADRRRANVRGAFEVVADLPWRHVAIVDDVVTTGHTVDELARTLRRAGVERVEVWAWAKTER
jgi:ComF family protein